MSGPNRSAPSAGSSGVVTGPGGTAGGNAGASLTVPDPISGGFGQYRATLNQATLTLTFPTTRAGLVQFMLRLDQDPTGGRLVTWPTNVEWPNAVAPTLSPQGGHFDLLAFDTTDAGATWQGRVVGGNYVIPAAPAAPVVTATAGDTVADLSWASVSATPSVTAYKVYRATTSGAETLLTTLAANAVSYHDTGLTDGTTYYYKVSAVNSLGETLSSEVSATPTAPVGPQFRSATTATKDSTGATTLTINVPTGVQNGDILVMAFGQGGTTLPTTPTGWTQLDTGIAGPSMATYWRVASGEPASYQFTGLTGTVHCAAFMAAYSNAAGIDAHGALNRLATSTAATANSITTTGANRKIIMAAMFGVTSTAITVTDPAGYTRRMFAEDPGNGIAIYVAGIDQAVAGATGSPTATASASGNTYAGLIAIR